MALPVWSSISLASAWKLETHTEATAVATTPSQHLPVLPHYIFARPAKVVAPELIGCLLVKRQPDGESLEGVIVETEA